KVDGFLVRIEIDPAGATRASVDFSHSFPPGISLSELAATPGRARVHIGAEIFDEIVCADGPEAPLRAMLNEAMRPPLADLVLAGGGLRNGKLQQLDPAAGNADSVLRLVRNAVALGRALSAQACDPPAALAANAGGDKVPEVRLLNLRALVNHYRDSPLTRE